MRTPDEWWDAQTPTRKQQYQQWLDPELGGHPHREVPGQLPLVHGDEPTKANAR